MTEFSAMRIDRTEAGTVAGIQPFPEADLMDGDVTVDVGYSSLNYKDALALTGKSPVVRRFPMIAGIDFAGTVRASSHPAWRKGDEVVCNGWGMGETHLGGYAERARVRGDWLVALPDGISPRNAMAIGTAGYTAMLAVLALEDHAIMPASGPVVVTGAVGGVGSIAISVLAKLGYHVVAATGRPSEAEYLRRLGASEIINRTELAGPARPLNKERWTGGIDSVGSVVLANLLSMTRYGGAVAACGLAGGMDLPSSVAPFILRGVRLLGIDSVRCPIELRRRAWARLATDLDMARLEHISQEVSWQHVSDLAEKMLQGGIRGRVVVRIDYEQACPGRVCTPWIHRRQQRLSSADAGTSTSPALSWGQARRGPGTAMQPVAHLNGRSLAYPQRGGTRYVAQVASPRPSTPPPTSNTISSRCR